MGSATTAPHKHMAGARKRIDDVHLEFVDYIARGAPSDLMMERALPRKVVRITNRFRRHDCEPAQNGCNQANLARQKALSGTRRYPRPMQARPHSHPDTL